MTPIDILLVEDNPGDIHLIKQAIGEQDARARVHVVRRGDEALEWLHHRGESTDAPQPQLVLLDLNIPIVDGMDVLDEIKTDAELKRLPVIVLTGSDSQRELNEAYEAHANACLVKPTNPDELTTVIQALEVFWMTAVTLPTRSDANSYPRR